MRRKISFHFIHLRLPEYMFQSRESSWRFPSTLQTILNLLLINLKRSAANQLKKEIKCFDFGSIKRKVRPPHKNIYNWINFNISICFSLWENMTILSK